MIMGPLHTQTAPTALNPTIGKAPNRTPHRNHQATW